MPDHLQTNMQRRVEKQLRKLLLVALEQNVANWQKDTRKLLGKDLADAAAGAVRSRVRGMSLDSLRELKGTGQYLKWTPEIGLRVRQMEASVNHMDETKKRKPSR